MKTTKLIILCAVAALTVYSCTSDREEDVQPTKLDLKELKTNKTGEANKIEKDTTQYYSPSSIGMDNGIDPVGNTNPNEGTNPTGPSPVVDPTKPDKPW